MTVQKKSVGEGIEAVVDLGGRPLVYDGCLYRDPAKARALAQALLRGAAEAEKMVRARTAKTG